MRDSWITIGEIEQQTNIPDRTIRRYINLHGHHISTKRHHRIILVDEQAVPTIIHIRDWYAAGWTADRIDRELAQSGLPVTIDDSGQDTVMSATQVVQLVRQEFAIAMIAMAERTDALHAQNESLFRDNQKLREQVAESYAQLSEGFYHVADTVTNASMNFLSIADKVKASSHDTQLLREQFESMAQGVCNMVDTVAATTEQVETYQLQLEWTRNKLDMAEDVLRSLKREVEALRAVKENMAETIESLQRKKPWWKFGR